MKHENDSRELDSILSAIGERELTDWERERLWELLEEHPDRIAEFCDHCFVSGELENVKDEDLLAAGIDPPIRNVVSMPGSATASSNRSRRWLVASGIAATAVAGFFMLPSTGPEPFPETTETEVSAPPARNGDLNLDDPNDEAVALSGAAALANSRNPRGGKPEGALSVPETISFNHHVRPILSENCFFCHGPDEEMQKADLRLDTVEGATEDLGGYAAIVPGDPEKSEAWMRILSDDPDDQMPPPESHRELSLADREILRRWIADGAQYDPHWAFMAPERPEVPEVDDKDWGKNPIDSFILSKLQSEGLAPNPEAAPRTLLRRLSLDLIGLPPTPEEIETFEQAYAADPDDTLAGAVDRLLASQHFGERMALAWLDASRYADSNGFQQDGNRHQWPWRDWVVEAYNDNMPFDRFTVEQLAGDLLENPTQDQIIATAFNRNHMLNGEGGAIKEEQQVNYVVDRVDTTATTWLGLTMACAQCHTHKYDPITHEEYFQFYAFFNNIPESGGVDKRSGSGCSFGSGATVQVSRPLLSLPTEEQTAEQQKVRAEIKEITARIAPLRETIAPLQAKWESGFTDAQLNDRKIFPGPISGVFRTPLEKRNANQKRDATEFYLLKGDHGNREWSDLGKTIKQLRDRDRKITESIVEIMVMEENPADKTRETFILARGDYQQPTDKVTPGVPAFLPDMPEGAPANRLGLAEWLVSPDHPLTARVTVNRIWQQFFGIGIVKTVEDFGVQGELPVHPELLDWLAVEFIESGWDVKHLVEIMVTSATYRQSAKATPEMLDRDPENRLLARAPRYRLPAMLLRDQALEVAGLLKKDVGGHPVYPHQPDGLWKDFSFGKINYPHQESAEQLHRRSLYTFWRRTSAPPNMFDSSSRQVCVVKPSITNTPLQALTLLNDVTYLEAARALAARMASEGGENADTRLDYAFELATGRLPDEREHQLLMNGYEKSLNEFQSFEEDAATYAGTSDGAIELAALTRMAQVILNLDETLNKP